MKIKKKMQTNKDNDELKNSKKKLKIHQAIVVEGKDDISAVLKACDALIIATHGFGITKDTLKIIEKAYKEKGIIILTDPDFSGEEIRRTLNLKFPKAINAYVPRNEAIADSDIGIENCSSNTIVTAIKKALLKSEISINVDRYKSVKNDEVTMQTLADLGLVSCEGSKERRQKVCDYLGIGYGNAKAVLKKMKGFNIGIEEIKQAAKETIQ